MMTVEEEEYVHFMQSIEDLNDAWRVLTAIRGRAAIGDVEAAAFRYALVAYARPYTGSRGVAKQTHRLGTDCVPAKYSDLHRRLVSARKQVHAHSDLSIREGTLRVRKVAGRNLSSQVRTCVDPLEELEHLDEVIDLVEHTLDLMYLRAEQMEQALPANQ